MTAKILFEQLLELIRSLDSASIETLSSGLSADMIESYIQIKPIPESLIDIYSCVDGDYSSEIIPAYALMPLTEINQEINMIREVKHSLINSNILTQEEIDKHFAGSDMIPFLDSHCGDHIWVRTLPNDRSIWCTSKYSQIEKINSSIDKFIISAIECYRQRAYYQELDEDEELVWTTNWDLAKEIVKKIDPEIEDYSPP